MLTVVKGRSGGVLYVCGGSYEGRLGQGLLNNQNMMYPRPIGGAISALPVAHMCCNMLHNIATDIEGHVWTWGWGGKGRLGHNNDQSCNVPTTVEGLSHVSVVQEVVDNDNTDESVTSMEDVSFQIIFFSIFLDIYCFINV